MNLYILALISIAFNIVGMSLIFFNSPQNNIKIDGGNAFTDFEKLNKTVNTKNKLMKLGFILILLGVAIQLILIVL
ncbi:MAG: hypothetical protein ACM31G_11615 [Flavobacteriales bacterium]